MTRRLRTVTFGLLAIIVLFLIYSFVASNRSQVENLQDMTELEQDGDQLDTADQQNNTVEILVNFGDGRIVSEEFPYDLEQTPFSVLQMVVNKNELEMETENYDFGVFVKSISGFESTPEMAWIYFVNGESGSVAADQYKLKPGDLVEWKYITPEGDEQ